MIAHFNEDLSWSEPVAKVRTVYTKGGGGVARSLEGRVRELPNVGLEQHSFLTHILTNYDTLAERTVFLHGRQPSCGFFRRDGQHGELARCRRGARRPLATTTATTTALAARSPPCSKLARYRLRSPPARCRPRSLLARCRRAAVAAYCALVPTTCHVSQSAFRWASSFERECSRLLGAPSYV